MQTSLNNIKEFLTYQISKTSTSETDRFIFLLQVLKPDLYEQALKSIFPDKNSTVSNDSPKELCRFAEHHHEAFSLPNGSKIDLERVNYAEVINTLFL